MFSHTKASSEEIDFYFECQYHQCNGKLIETKNFLFFLLMLLLVLLLLLISFKHIESEYWLGEFLCEFFLLMLARRTRC